MPSTNAKSQEEALHALEQQLGLRDQQIVKLQEELGGRVDLILKLDRENRNLRNLTLDTAIMLAMLAELRDDLTGKHMFRIGAYAGALAAKFGIISNEAKEIGRAAVLHDVGKALIPDLVLKKPGKLTAAEMQDMEKHTTIGAWVLRRSETPFYLLAGDGAEFHHQWWNGNPKKSYPHKDISGLQIPVIGRIIRLVDVFDSLSEKRIYRDPMAGGITAVRKEIEDGKGSSFQPDLVDAFQDMRDEELREIREGAHKEEILPGILLLQQKEGEQ